MSESIYTGLLLLHCNPGSGKHFPIGVVYTNYIHPRFTVYMPLDIIVPDHDHDNYPDH